MFKFLLYKIGQFFVTNLSLKVSYRLATFFSDLQYFFSPRDRRSVVNNLRQIMGDRDDLRVLAREVFRNFGLYLVEFFRSEKMLTRDYVKQNIQVKDIERIGQVLEKGKGAIILTAHIGNWEMGAAAVSLLGYPLVAIALPHKERPVNELFNHQRQAKGVAVVSTNIAVRKCVDTLRKNGLVAIIADRDFSDHGEIIDFLGRKVLIPKGAAVFALKTGAAIVPTFLIRQPGNTFVLSVEEPIWPPTPQEKDKNIDKQFLTDLMKRYAKVIEDQIKLYPTQWLMFREFGKEHQRELQYQP
jgi:KDO2-lipid IV(A) lauroyltransferase